MAIHADWSGSVAEFLQSEPLPIAQQLAHAAQQRFRVNGMPQLRAWMEQCIILAAALRDLEQAAGWRLMFEVSLPRMGRRADAVLLTGRTIIVLEFKIGAARATRAAREQAEDFALDLQDFHAGSRGRPILPVVVVTGAAMGTPSQPALPIGGVAPVVDASADTLSMILARCDDASFGPVLDHDVWCDAPYRPVPPIIEAACNLYARHDVEEMLDARAGAVSLAATSAALTEAVAEAERLRQHQILFVTGVPGAGKTLCGLNACFSAAAGTRRATFLTGNPSLVHVLREALVRDARRRGMDARAARQRMEGVIQALPRFRDLYAGAPDEIPPERVIVIDEAQRSWSREHAIRKSRDRTPRLTDSEPGHLLEAMGRHRDWAVVICLVGQGQEIHDGEGGLAEWGRALGATRVPWRAVAAPDCLAAGEPRRRLPLLADLRVEPRLHLSVPTRQIGHPTASDWVDAVLDGDAARAADIARFDTMPYRLTRELAALRAGLRGHSRGTRRCGLLASSGASRLRADGLGVELPHTDGGLVARWFLDRWPDVRASDALEVTATEFAAQGLELDVTGLCWGADLLRVPGVAAWSARAFVGTRWQNRQSPEAIANRINAYRVLLTRARHITIIWVPRGDPADATRCPRELDDIADFLRACGVQPLRFDPAVPEAPEPAGLFESLH